MKKILFVFTLIALISCKKDKSYRVNYEVMSDYTGFVVTYLNDAGVTITEEINSRAWKIEFTGKSDQSLYVSAQTKGEAASIAARIYVNGGIDVDQTTKGDYTISTVNTVLD